MEYVTKGNKRICNEDMFYNVNNIPFYRTCDVLFIYIRNYG